MKIQFAVNPNFVGKVPGVIPESVYLQIYRKLNGGFRNYSAPISHLIEHIQNGHPYTNWHANYRKAANFLTAQIIGLDFDREFAVDEFIINHASFMHTTDSHTAENPRHRVVFVLDRPIGAVAFSKIVLAILVQYPDADEKCKDPVRLFFGAKDCEVTNFGNVLSLEYAAERLVKPYEIEQAKKERVAKRAAANKTIASPESVNGSLERALEDIESKIIASPDGQKANILYAQAYRMGGLVGSGYINRYKAETILEGAIMARGNIRSEYIALNTIERGLNNGVSAPLDLYEPKETFSDWGLEI